MHNIYLGMAGGTATPLTEILQIVHRVETREHQHRIEHRRHMARIEEETVAEGIGGVLGIESHKFGVENIDEIGTAHSASGMTRLSFFYHSSSQNTDIIGCFIEF